MRALLDINVLIALLDAGHIMHQMATNWLSSNLQQGWATCPITQNGVIRIMSQPAYPIPKPAAEVAYRLNLACQNAFHTFWPANLSLADGICINWKNILGHRQVTDAYLFALAVANKGYFVTFDQHIDINAISGAKKNQLVVIGDAL